MFKRWTGAAALALLAPFAAHAATEANFGPATTADLVELCTATPDNAMGTAAVNFCQGFALGATYRRSAAESGIDPALLHRIAVIGAGTLDSLPQNGAVVTLLAVCGSTHRESYLDIVMAAIAGPIIALAVVIALGSAFGSF